MSHIEKIKSLLKVYHFDKKIRLGVHHDGGYVLGDLNNHHYDCYISAGVSNEESFSRDFINHYKTKKENNYAFDGTIHDYPYEYTNEIQFNKKNIDPNNSETTTNLKYLFEKYNQIFMKMDIEGAEIPWLLSLSSEELSKFKQIVIEFHGITDDGWGSSYDNKIKVFEKLNQTHYIIHAHGNNYGHTVENIPYVIELTYVNKNVFTNCPLFHSKNNPLPQPKLDYPNCPDRPDIDMSAFLQG